MTSHRISRRRLLGMAGGLAASASSVAARSSAGRAGARFSALSATQLQCEYRIDPLGIDTTAPRLSWQLVDPADTRGQRQTAYRVRIASRRADLLNGNSDLWDSGRIASDASVGVVYAGRPLLAGEVCWWQVMAWDRDGAPTTWSVPARFSVGLLQERDWRAQWIGMAAAGPAECPYFRKSFSLRSVPDTALAYVSSIGYHELYINGRRVGDRVLSPSVSDLRKRALYVTYDIRDYVRHGENVVALWTAPGWGPFRDANPPVDFGVAKSALCIAQIQLASPREPHEAKEVVTDSSWRCALSTTRHLGRWQNGDFGGDYVDARSAIPNWNDVGLNESGWQAATVYTPRLRVSPDPVEPNRRCETIPAVRIDPLGDGRYQVQMARIFTGWLELRLTAAPGAQVTVAASSQRDRAVEYNQVDRYVVGPEGSGVFSPRFSYHQYHYVTLEGFETAPTLDQITGYRISNDRRRIGVFDCSNALVKSIYDATVRTYVNLSTGGMTVDCPHRERLGYGGDGHTSMELALDTFRSNAFFAKWAQDWCDIQDPDGSSYHTAPTRGGGGGPAWSGFVITMPFAVYQAYGDRRILERTYPTARRWLASLAAHVGADGLLAPLPGKGPNPADGYWFFLGDWAAPRRSEASNSPEALLFNNCYYVYVLRLAAKVADLLGKPAERTEYEGRIRSLREAIDRRFYSPDAHAYLDTRETHCILPLVSGVVPPDRMAAVQQTFEHELLVTQGGHLDTGLHGTYFMTKYLTEHGRSDLVFTYATRPGFPGYAELLANGYTTWPEYWGGSDSKTHGCLNGIGGWFQRGLAGIRPDPANPGYRNVVIRPALVGDLTFVAARHHGPYGRIDVRWDRHPDGKLHLAVTIPPNSTADVYVPNPHGAPVTETDIPAAHAPGVTALGTENGASVFHVISGSYRFVTNL